MSTQVDLITLQIHTKIQNLINTNHFVHIFFSKIVLQHGEEKRVEKKNNPQIFCIFQVCKQKLSSNRRSFHAMVYYDESRTMSDDEDNVDLDSDVSRMRKIFIKVFFLCSLATKLRTRASTTSEKRKKNMEN